MKGLYSWRLAGLSSFRFLVSHPLSALRLFPFAILLWTLPLHAGGVVTNCTEANLRAALAGGGTVTFACDGTIVLTSTNEHANIVITNHTILDATGHTVSLSGNHSNRIFFVENAAKLSLINLTLKDGRSWGGSAILNGGGEVTLLNCTFDRNSSVSGSASGGAIHTGVNFPAKLRATNCTFSANNAISDLATGGMGAGGAIYNGNAGPDPAGDITLVNCTFYGNIASGTNGFAGYGGAVAHWGGNLEAINCTFSGNAAFGNPQYTRGGALVIGQGPAVLRNCILANNPFGKNAFTNSAFYPLIDGGNNISDDDSCNFSQPTSRNNTDPRLGPLRDNGGPTKTMALLAGSPAIDAGNNATCPTTDQRGVARPVGAACDIGAYEGAFPVLTFGQAFSPDVILEGGVSRLEFTLRNTNGLANTGVAFTNYLPAEVRIAATPAVTNSCGSGTVLVTPGGSAVIFHGGIIGSNQSCSVSVDVTASAHGAWVNPAVSLWSIETGPGSSSGPAMLLVGGAPAVSTGPASSGAANSVRLSATVNPSGFATAAFFQYGTTTNFDQATPPQTLVAGYDPLPLSAELSGLIPGTPYYYRAVGSNVHGVSYGATLVATPGVQSCGYGELLVALTSGAVVTFACDGTITLTNTLVIDRDTTLDGSGHDVVLSGGNAVRVLTVNPGVRLTLINLTIADGRHTGTNGTNFMGTAGAGFGGGIYNQGDLKLLNCVLSNNAAVGGDGLNYGVPGGTGMGGAIFNEGGVLLITNCLFRQNGAIGGMARFNSPIYIGSAVASGDGFGGAIFSRNGLVSIERTRFLTNAASSGAPVPWGFPGNVGPWGSASGGALHLDGGTMELAACLLAENSVVRIPGSGRNTLGSGVYTGGAITVSNGMLRCWQTTFATNRVDVPNGFSGGGAVFDRGEVRLVDCVLAGNRAIGAVGAEAKGGGALNLSSMVIAGCTLAGNTALGADGGFTQVPIGSTGNPAGNGLGGGIHNLGNLLLTNTTLVANRALGGNQLSFSGPIVPGLARGGGLFQAGGTGILLHSTLSGNTTAGGAGGLPITNTSPALGDGIYVTNGTVTLWNSIVANSGSGSNCFGALIDGGHNLSSDGSCNFTASGSLNNTDPLLGPLGDYGGPTPTLPLLIGSPALNAADSAHCPAKDQRGVARPFGAACDSGAFELAPTYPMNSLTLESADSGVARLVFAGAPSHSYQLLVSTNLPNWLPLATRTTDALGLFQFPVTTDGDGTCRFFKVADQ